MTTEELHTIVISLSSKQKTAFSNWVKATNRKGDLPKFHELFKRISKQPQLSEDKLKKGLFSSTSLFIKYRNVLVEKLVEALSLGEAGECEYRKKILTALEIGAIEYAKVLFSDRCIHFYEGQNFDDLSWFIKTREETLEDFSIDLFITEGTSTWNKIRATVVEYQTIIGLYREARNSLKHSVEDRKVAFIKIKEAVSRLDARNIVQQYYLSKTKAILHVLNGNPGHFHQNQVEIGESLGKYAPVLRPLQYVRNLSNTIISHLYLGNNDQALRFYMKLSAWEPGNHIENRQKSFLQISRNIDVAYSIGDQDLIEGAFSSLNEQRELFSIEMLAFKLYIVSLSALRAKSIVISRRALYELRKIPKNDWGKMDWQPEIMRLILCFEQNSVGEDWEYIYPSVKRAVDKSPFKYPQFILQSLNQIANSANPEESLISIQNGQKILESNPKEKRQMDFLDFSLWADSYFRTRSMISILEERKDKPDAQLGLKISV